MGIVVLGAGVGGLALAARLAARGEEVLVLEKEATVGGKMRSLSVGGADVDAGPTVLTMPWVFDELFAACGGDFRADVELLPLDVLARHQWPDGTTLDLHADEDASADAIARFAGAAEGAAYRRFAAYGRGLLASVREPFLLSPLPTARDLLSPQKLFALRAFASIDGTRTQAKAIASFFRDERLRMLFGRYATYTGSSPYRAPATLNVIACVEQEGVWVVRGGMMAFAQALAGLARRAGAEIRTGAEVEEILVEHGRAAGVRLRGGERVAATSVVSNGDASDLPRLVPSLRAAGARAEPSGERSLSAVVATLRADVSGFPLAHHTVFFPRDYAREHADLFERRTLPGDPTIYVCAQDRGPFGAPTVADGKSGGERLLVLVNAPAEGHAAAGREEIESCIERTRDTLSARGLTVSPRAIHITGPGDFAALFPGTQGALYGAASHGITSALTRPSARTKIPGLYAVGGSVHPGAGVPMAALSARLAASALLSDSASTRPSRAAGTPGGTWTAPATADATR